MSNDERQDVSQREVATLTPIESAKSEGLYRDLELLLQEQIKAHPEDERPYVKLLELYFESKKPEDFLRTARIFNDKFRKASSQYDWEDVVEMGKKLLPNEQLFMSMNDGFEFVVPDDESESGVKKRLGEGEKYAEFFAELSSAYEEQRKNKLYVKELDRELQHTLNRPVSMMHAKQISEIIGGAQIFLKREDLSPPLTHVGISITGQAVLARRLGKERLVTASTDGFRGVLMASIARRMGMDALVFMEESAVQEQPSNMRRLELMGAEVQPVHHESLRSGDLRTVALDYCLNESETSFMVMGLDGAPQPYPQILMESVAVIGRETLLQIYAETKKLPSMLVARGGNNADAIGFFAPFLSLKSTQLACVTPLPEIVDPEMLKSGALGRGKVAAGRHQRTASRILEGLEYPSVGREHAWLRASGRLIYPEVKADQVKQAIRGFSHHEGMIPALETAHALAYACEAASKMKPDESVVVVIAERVDKDIPHLEKLMQEGII